MSQPYADLAHARLLDLAGAVRALAAVVYHEAPDPRDEACLRQLREADTPEWWFRDPNGEAVERRPLDRRDDDEPPSDHDYSLPQR